MAEHVKRRPYDASGRRERARRTQQEIVEAARTLFVSTGYAGTTVADVAASAGVSVETVYAAFRTKAKLLKTVFDVTIAGDDEPVPLMDRPAILAIRAEPDPDRALRLYAAFVAEIAPRTYPIHIVVLAAAPSEPAVAELATELDDQRLAGMTMFAQQLRDSGQLSTTEAEARDLLWSLNSPQLYQLLVVERGWTLHRYEEFLASTWTHTLLDRDGTAARDARP